MARKKKIEPEEKNKVEEIIRPVKKSNFNLYEVLLINCDESGKPERAGKIIKIGSKLKLKTNIDEIFEIDPGKIKIEKTETLSGITRHYIKEA